VERAENFSSNAPNVNADSQFRADFLAAAGVVIAYFRA
jgi:hypothetical protein